MKLLRRTSCTLFNNKHLSYKSSRFFSSNTTKPRILTPDQVNFFHTNGYLKLDEFFNKNIMIELKTRIKNIINGSANNTDPHYFNTDKDQHKYRDQYFLQSAENISIFLEEGTNDINLNTVNKIGHGLHIYDEIFQNFSLNNSKFGDICEDIGLKNACVPQSMYILNQLKLVDLLIHIVIMNFYILHHYQLLVFGCN